MATDDERREVARRLRDMRLKPWDDPACEIALCVGVVCCNSECHGSDESPECAMSICNRLADLIEPGEPKGTCVAEVKVDGERLEQLVHDAAVELTGIDREALLALADEMDDCGLDGWACGPVDVGGCARRIREACGEASA